MNNKELYVSEVINSLKELLPNADIQTLQRTEWSVAVNILIIKEEKTVIPFEENLDAYCYSYSTGMSSKEIASKILSHYQKHEAFIADFNNIKSNLFIKLINNNAAVQESSETIGRSFEDIYMFPYIAYIDEDISIFENITKKLVAHWNKTEDEFFAMAIANSAQNCPANIKVLDNNNNGDKEFKRYATVSTTQKGNGARAILYDGVLASIADKLDDDLVIFPHSTIGWTLIPLKDVDNMEDLAYNLFELNQKKAESGDQEFILSNHLYLYARETTRITTIK